MDSMAHLGLLLYKIAGQCPSRSKKVVQNNVPRHMPSLRFLLAQNQHMYMQRVVNSRS